MGASYVPGLREHQRDGHFGNRVGISAGGIEQFDVPLLDGLVIDAVRSASADAEILELGSGFDHFSRDRAEMGHEKFGLREVFPDFFRRLDSVDAMLLDE